MNKARILLGLGLWVAFLPYLGFPYFLKSILFVLTGLGLIYLSFILYRESRRGDVSEKVFENFSENLDFNENEIR